MKRLLIILATVMTTLIACTAVSFATVDIGEFHLILVKPDIKYTGTDICPEITLVQTQDSFIYDEETGELLPYDEIYNNYMDAGRDNWYGYLLPSTYDVTYTNNVNVGKATVTVTAKEGTGWEGSISQDFNIYKRKVSLTKVVNNDHSVTIKCGELKDKIVSVKVDGYKLIKGTDYKVLNNGNIKLTYEYLSGTARMYKDQSKHTVNLDFKNNYASLNVKSYNLKGFDYAFNFKRRVAYTGKNTNPGLTITGLTKGTNYKIVYNSSKRVSIGKHYFTVKAIAPYKGTAKLHYTVIPVRPAFESITRASSYVKIKWKKVKNCSGYQVKLYKIRPDYEDTDEEDSTITTLCKTFNISGRDNTSKKINVPKSKWNYIQLRSYKVVNGVKIYSNDRIKDYFH